MSASVWSPNIDTVDNVLRAALLASSGASLVGSIKAAIGAVSTNLATRNNWQTPSVLEFMTDVQRADVMAGTCLLDVSAAVQKAVDHCLLNSKDLTVEGLCRIDTPVNINRPVNGSSDEFHIIGVNSKGGFWTSQPINIFSSSIPGFTPGGASSEFVVFDKVRFEASVNTLNCFAVDGNAFLRIKFNFCYWRKIRNAYTSNFFQSWYFIAPNVRKLHGIWMEAGIGGDSYVGLDGFAFDIHVTDPIFEEGDMAGQSAGFKFAGQWNGGSIKGGLYQGQTGPFVEVIGGGTVLFEGTYFEAVVQSCFKLGRMYAAAFNGNRFGTGTDPAYWPIDCQTAYTVVGTGNFSEGNIYKSSTMQSTRTLNDAGFYRTKAKGLLSIGDVAYNGNITDDASHSNNFQRLQTETLLAGLDDFTIGAGRQKVAGFKTDGVSGTYPRGSFNFYTTAGARDTNMLYLYASDVANGEYATPVVTFSNDLVATPGKLRAGAGLEVVTGLTKVAQYTTGTRPAYVKGAMYFDITTNKLVIGGAAGWETITSA